MAWVVGLWEPLYFPPFLFFRIPGAPRFPFGVYENSSLSRKDLSLGFHGFFGALYPFTVNWGSLLGTPLFYRDVFRAGHIFLGHPIFPHSPNSQGNCCLGPRSFQGVQVFKRREKVLSLKVLGREKTKEPFLFPEKFFGGQIYTFIDFVRNPLAEFKPL